MDEARCAGEIERVVGGREGRVNSERSDHPVAVPMREQEIDTHHRLIVKKPKGDRSTAAKVGPVVGSESRLFSGGGGKRAANIKQLSANKGGGRAFRTVLQNDNNKHTHTHKDKDKDIKVCRQS